MAARIAERQGGVISIGQLRAAGLARGAVHHRVRTGRLTPTHRGVYVITGAPLTWRGRLWAAVLATNGVISHRSAAAVWDLLSVPGGPVDVIAKGSSVAGIRVHRVRTLEPGRDITRQADGLPVTTVARTIFDLAPQLSTHRLERLCHRAEVLRLLDSRAFEVLPPRRNLRAALASLADTGTQTTRSELEERFLELVVEAGLPRPLVNATVAGLEVDFYWPEFDLAVEADGAGAHLNPTAFERDRDRDAVLRLAGVQPLRFTHRRITRDPATVIATLRQLAC